MIPNVFVSSTILDLHHLREAIRETILELGFNSVMSEHGDIGYLPSVNVTDACYFALKDCQLAVIIVAKRYGSITENGLSVTHNELNSAQKNNIPIITLVEQDVLAYQRVYNANRGKEQVFPDMDDAKNTFKFIDQIKASPVNNGIITFSTASDARTQLKKQISHFIGDILRRQFDPLQYQIKDVLSELKTFRHELRKDKKTGDSSIYLRAFRYLLDDRRDGSKLGNFVEHIVGSLDDAVPKMLGFDTFEEFIASINAKIEIVEGDAKWSIDTELEGAIMMQSWIIRFDPDSNMHKVGKYSIFPGKNIRMNKNAKRWFDFSFDEFQKTALRGGKLTTS